MTAKRDGTLNESSSSCYNNKLEILFLLKNRKGLNPIPAGVLENQDTLGGSI